MGNVCEKCGNAKGLGRQLQRLCVVCDLERIASDVDALAAKDATIARLEAEVAELKRAMALRHKDTMKWVDLHTKLEAENAGLRERAEGLARECRAWRDEYAYYDKKCNDGEGDPILGEVMFDIDEDIRKATDAAGWLKPKEAT